MDMVKKRVAELEGAQLDWAVAMAGEEWKTAHRFYPTMTLDPTFAGVSILERGGKQECWLKPNNPMRQGPQPFWPSREWEHGGPIIERERIALRFGVFSGLWSAWPIDDCDDGVGGEDGPTPLIAAMRAFVGSKLGDIVEVPV